jgi:DNA (cytosine-5)-methyltransferase 1
LEVENIFTFIDLFAGIGGMRLGFDECGGTCIFSSEMDPHARDTYEANFSETPEGDIRGIDAEMIPEHDILLAGFPCQPFSIAGVSKLSSMGEEHGFLNETKGTLFFDICRILEQHNPRAFLLENVKGLLWHGNPLEKINGVGPKRIKALLKHFGSRSSVRYASEEKLREVPGIGKILAKRIHESRTFVKIMKTLKGLGYTVKWKVINSKNFVPQRRERVFIVGFNDGTEFEFPDTPDDLPVLRDILEKKVDEKYTINDHLWNYHQKRKREQKEKGNGFGYHVFNHSQSSGTLPARYNKDGADILIEQEGKNPRKLTPRECARLMGFSEDFILNKSENQMYIQFGNSVVVPLVALIASAMVAASDWGISS